MHLSISRFNQTNQHSTRAAQLLEKEKEIAPTAEVYRAAFRHWNINLHFMLAVKAQGGAADQSRPDMKMRQSNGREIEISMTAQNLFTA